MAYPHEENAIEDLFKSRGAQIYWENLNQVKSWYHFYMLPELHKCHLPMQDGQQQQQTGDHKPKHRRQRRGKRRKRKKTNSLSNNKNTADEEETNEQNSVEPMSKEFMEFYQTTLQHRSNLKKLREAEGVTQPYEYAADDQGPEGKPTLSTAPPEFQAGSERTKQLQVLYGSNALKIQSLETQIQAKFDEYRTKRQPKLWPVIPLKL